MVHFETKKVNHRNEFLIIGRRTRRPILSQIRAHVDMVAQKIQHRLTEIYGNEPCTLSIPSEWGWKFTPDLDSVLSLAGLAKIDNDDNGTYSGGFRRYKPYVVEA